MPLYAGELNIRRGAPLAEFPAPMSEVLRAQSEETQLHNPMQALRRMIGMTDAERGEVLPPESDMDAEIRRAPVKRLDAETARNRVKEEGLKLTIPDEGISERALDILVRRKREEMQRQDIFSRGPSGIGPGAARLGTALVESLFDPLNIASAFVPVVGPARYAAMVRAAASPLARAGIRAEVGAIEGAVGAAILEPLIYSAAQSEQLDYTMYDSLANIAFGGVFGGGLHMAGGAVRDVMRPGWWRTVPEGIEPESARAIAVTSEPEVHQAALRTSVVQAVEGRPIDVDPFIPRRITADSPEFKAWFEGSKFAERDGSPTVLYHQTSKESAENIYRTGFDLNRVGARGSDPYVPDGVFLKPFDNDIGLGATDRAQIAQMQVYAKAKNPITFRNKEELQSFLNMYEPYYKASKKAEAIDRRITREYDELEAQEKAKNLASRSGFGDDYFARADELFERGNAEYREASAEARKHATDFLKQEGFDGVLIREDIGSFGRKTTTYIVFDPNQIASATAERGPLSMAELIDAARKNAGEVRSAESEAAVIADRSQSEAAKPVDLKVAEESFEQSVSDAEMFAEARGVDLKEKLTPYAEAIKRTDDYAKALRVAAACGLG